jgi:hypothetical protein
MPISQVPIPISLLLAMYSKPLNVGGQDTLSTDNVKDLKEMATLVDSFSAEIEKSKNNKLLVEL